MKTMATYRYPDLQELEAYSKGLLDHGRAHEIEALALDDPLLAEAIEGFEEVPAFAEAAQLKVPAPTSGTPWWHLAGWGIGLVAGVILAVLVYKSVNPAKTQPIITSELSEQQNTIEEKNEVTKQLTVDESQQDIIVPKPQTDVIRPDNQSNPIVTRDPGDRFDSSEIKVIERANAGPVLLDVRTQDPALKKSSYGDGANLLHWRNYKLIDYSEVRKKQWPDFDGPTNHTPANQENSDGDNDLLRTETTQVIPYIDYLDKCIDAFRNGEFNSAAAHFDVILAQYPDDLNGQFYGAMSHYHLGEYEKAVNLFDLSLNNVFRTFREESEFYKAMSLLGLNKKSEARELLLKIASANGFYAPRATQELKKL